MYMYMYINIETLTIVTRREHFLTPSPRPMSTKDHESRIAGSQLPHSRRHYEMPIQSQCLMLEAHDSANDSKALILLLKTSRQMLNLY